MSWVRRGLLAAVAIAGAIAAAAGPAAALPACPASNTYPFTANCPLPAAKLNAALQRNETHGAIFYAKDYGACTWDAEHDVGPCINLAVAAAVANSAGEVVCPAGRLGLGTIVGAHTSNIGLSCGPKRGTTLVWIGSIGGRMVSFAALYGDLTKSRLEGTDIDLWVDGNGRAADGLYMASLLNGRVNFRATGAFNGGAVLSYDNVPALPGSTFLGAIDIQNMKTNYEINVTGTSIPLYLGSYMTGTGSHGNASFNHFYENIIVSDAAKGIWCWGCDNNIWEKGRIFGPAISVDLDIATSGAAFFAANGNKFLHGFQTQTPLVARGAPTVGGCAPVTINPGSGSCTYANSIERDQTNGTPGPTIEAGADLKDSSNEGFLSGLSLYGISNLRPGLVSTETGSTIQSCLANAFIYGPIASNYSCNTAEGAMHLFDDLAGDRYSVSMAGVAGAKNFQFNHLAGTGLWRFSNSSILVDNSVLPTTTGFGQLGDVDHVWGAHYSQAWLSRNTSHTWAMNFGLVPGTADAAATTTHDGVNVMTLGADNSVTVHLGLKLPPMTAPASPANGWTVYTDSGDSNKLKAKASTGTVVTLGTP